jgi:amino acid transporter
MTDKTVSSQPSNPMDTFFTPKHARLTDLALAAKILSWVMLVIFIGFFIFAVLTEKQTFAAKSLNDSTAYFIETLFKDPGVGLNIFFKTANRLVQAISYWVGLQGLAYCFSMLTEISLNVNPNNERKELPGQAYKGFSLLKKRRVGKPEFYDPQKITRLIKWLNWGAIFSVIISIIQTLQSSGNTISYAMKGYETGIPTPFLIIITLITLGLSILTNYLPLKGLAYILQVLTEIDFTANQPV